jgi:DnaK suppressor protein
MPEKNLSSEPFQAPYSRFYQMLLDRMNEIVPRELTARTNLDQQTMENPGDDGDLSVSDTSADYFLMLAEAHQRELAEIREAINRMHREVYGVCESCEQEISKERLTKIPAARLCIVCQSERERRNMTVLPGGKRNTL